MRLIDYIRGNRHGRKANTLERKAIDDPFLSEAIEGYDLVEGNHRAAIDRMRHRVTEQTLHQIGLNRRLLAVAAVAASVAVAIVVIDRSVPVNRMVRRMELLAQGEMEIADRLPATRPTSTDKGSGEDWLTVADNAECGGESIVAAVAEGSDRGSEEAVASPIAESTVENETDRSSKPQPLVAAAKPATPSPDRAAAPRLQRAKVTEGTAIADAAPTFGTDTIELLSKAAAAKQTALGKGFDDSNLSTVAKSTDTVATAESERSSDKVITVGYSVAKAEKPVAIKKGRNRKAFIQTDNKPERYTVECNVVVDRHFVLGGGHDPRFGDDPEGNFDSFANYIAAKLNEYGFDGVNATERETVVGFTIDSEGALIIATQNGSANASQNGSANAAQTGGNNIAKAATASQTDLNGAICKALRQSPRWTPATLNDRPQSVRCTLTVHLK